MIASLLPLAAFLVPALAIVEPLNTPILGPYGNVPPVYPSPNTTGVGGWEEALAKAKAFVSNLTLAEKADMVTGTPGPCTGNIVAIPRLGFPGLCLQDGPLAIRIADYASVFPAGVSTAASFDRELMYERGVLMGAEFKAKGSHVALGPVAGPLGRSAYAGRNWEGFSSDPYLTGVAMEETITGMQSNGLQACAKHFIAYEQETQRNPTYDAAGINIIQESVSSNLDDRTMHELYLWPFANAVRAGVSSIMCSYNRINGTYACENSKSLNGLLKEELGFQGYVMSDWGGTHSGMSSIEGGLDMNMPGGLGEYGMTWAPPSYFGGNVTNAINNGSLDTSRLDDMIQRIMTPYYLLGQDSEDFPTVDPSSADLNTFSPRSSWLRNFTLTGTSNRDVRGNHSELIRKLGAASAVLLKNVNNSLPLKAPKSIAVFGNDASEDVLGYYNMVDFEYGTLSVGGGSGTGRLSYLVTPLEALKVRAAKDGALVQQFINNTLVATTDVSTLTIPVTPDVCIVFLKTWAEEGADRLSLDTDWNGTAVVESVAAYCPNTVVVTHSSGINNLPFADHENVTAILAAHYPGQESGNAVVDILYGDVNPSAKLPYTIALETSDYNALPITNVTSNDTYAWQAYFDEKLEIDYRYFDAQNISVRYEFGFGLSYTSFSLSNLTISKSISGNITALPAAEAILPGGNPALWDTLYNVTVVLQNTGSVAGAEVPQLYVSLPSSAPTGTPKKQLRGFEKVYLEPGENKSVSFGLARRDVSYWNTTLQEWVIPEGVFGVSAGFSSRDIKLSGSVTIV